MWVSQVPWVDKVDKFRFRREIVSEYVNGKCVLYCSVWEGDRDTVNIDRKDMQYSSIGHSVYRNS